MKSLLVFRFLLVLTALVLGSTVARAQDLGAVKQRMEQRLATVNSLKDRGVVGENNQGYLDARGAASAADQQVISQENADRRTVYTALAQQTGATAETVGRHRAQQIASIAKPGHWIQDPSGEWRQKQ